ncbi:MAG: response regulator [Syntrophobacteraceae bacterium]
MANGDKPDRILLDIQLPSMDGYKVARTLRTNPDLFVVPIVAVTSWAMVRESRENIEFRLLRLHRETNQPGHLSDTGGAISSWWCLLRSSRWHRC